MYCLAMKCSMVESSMLFDCGYLPLLMSNMYIISVPRPHVFFCFRVLYWTRTKEQKMVDDWERGWHTTLLLCTLVSHFSKPKPSAQAHFCLLVGISNPNPLLCCLSTYTSLSGRRQWEEENERQSLCQGWHSQLFQWLQFYLREIMYHSPYSFHKPNDK